MAFPPSPRWPAVLASVLAAAGIALTVASCSSVTPIGPDNPASPVRPRHLGSPIILQAMRSQPATAAGACAAGWAAVSALGNPDQDLCYRKLGTPVTITSAGVGPIPTPATSPAGRPVRIPDPPGARRRCDGRDSGHQAGL